MFEGRGWLLIYLYGVVYTNLFVRLEKPDSPAANNYQVLRDHQLLQQ